MKVMTPQIEQQLLLGEYLLRLLGWSPGILISESKTRKDGM